MAKAEECRNCKAGKYQHENAAASVDCSFCAKGRYYDTMSTDCLDCPNGKYQSEITTEEIPSQGFRQVVCSFCVVGKSFKDDESSCPLCPTGKYQEENAKASATCDFCSKGFAFTNNQSACAACLNGMYHDSNTEASSVCKTCAEGQYASSSLVGCTSCPTGKVQNRTEAPTYTCDFCLAGFFFDDRYEKRSKVACKTCENGKYQEQNDFASAACKTCTALGKYAPNSSYPCIDCVEPFFQLIVPNTNYKCTTCAAGKVFEGIAEKCFGCATGRYASTRWKNGKNRPYCAQCDKGKAIQSQEDIKCRNCQAGYYQDKASTSNNVGGSTIDATPLVPDDPDKYLCSTCPVGWGFVNKRSSCNECEIGRYQNITAVLRVPFEKCTFLSLLLVPFSLVKI